MGVWKAARGPTQWPQRTATEWACPRVSLLWRRPKCSRGAPSARRSRGIVEMHIGSEMRSLSARSLAVRSCPVVVDLPGSAPRPCDRGESSGLLMVENR